MFGELIVVDNLRPNEIMAEDAPYKSRESQTWKQLNEFHFESLWEILTDDAEAIKNEHITVFTAGGGEVWLIVFSKQFRSTLAKLPSENEKENVSKWANTEEFKWDWKEADILELYRDLCALAKHAELQNKSLVYWGRL